jgi:hypothetical protein
MKQIGMVCFVEGVLPEVKKWCQPCLWIEYACRQWDNWTYTQEASFVFFPWGEGGGWIKKNSCVSIMLPACPHIFSRFRMCSSRILPITPHFIPYPLPKLVFPFSPIYRWAKGKLLLERNCYFGEPLKFLFFCVRGQSKWPIAKK